MSIDKRKDIRFEFKFSILSNEISGYGINISKGGFGFYTEDEIIPAFEIPFVIEINDADNKDAKFAINGIGNLLYSKLINEEKSEFYNGFEIVKMNKDNKVQYKQLLTYIEDHGI